MLNKIFCVLFFFLIVGMTFFFFQKSEKSFYVEKKYDTGVEHLDIKMGGVKFEIDHFVTSNKNHVIVSEHISGVYIKSLSGEYYLFPLSRIENMDDENRSASLGEFGVIPVCIYKPNGNKKDIVAFFDMNRGMIEIDGGVVHLSSLFLGRKGKHICPALLPLKPIVAS